MKKGKPMKKTALLLAVLLPFCAAHAAGGKAQSREQARRKADEKAVLDWYAKTHTLEREKDVIRQYQQRNDPESREIAAAEEKLAPEQEIVVRTHFTAGTSPAAATPIATICISTCTGTSISTCTTKKPATACA